MDELQPTLTGFCIGAALIWGLLSIQAPNCTALERQIDLLEAQIKGMLINK